MSKKPPYSRRPVAGRPQAAKTADHNAHHAPYKTTAPAAEKSGKQPAAKLFAIDRGNYKYIGAGIVVMVLGFALMIGGGSNDPNVFNGEALFSFTRITLSTILVVTGFAIEIVAIMKRPSKPKTPKAAAGVEE